MDPYDKWKLRSNRRALLDVDTSLVCPYLIQEGIITPDDSERIDHEATFKDKIETLLNLLETKKESAFATFRDSLKETGREDILQLLDGTDMNKMPANLKKKLNDKQEDTTDRGNIIITDQTTGQKRQISIEDEGYRSNPSHSRGPRAKRSNAATSIMISGDNNCVVDNSKISITYYK